MFVVTPTHKKIGTYLNNSICRAVIVFVDLGVVVILPPRHDNNSDDIGRRTFVLCCCILTMVDIGCG